MKLMDEMKRGEEAERLLNHPLLVEAFSKVRDGLIAAMQDAPIGDEKTHNRLVIALQLHEQMKKQIADVMTTGKLAKLQLDDPAVTRLKRAVGF